MQTAPIADSSNSPRFGAVLSALAERRRKTKVDREIAEAIGEAFEASSDPEVEGLHFYVFEGAVSIYGAVSSDGQRDRVLASVSRVPGIAHIADHMTVFGR